jgi:hypothetical protein
VCKGERERETERARACTVRTYVTTSFDWERFLFWSKAGEREKERDRERERKRERETKKLSPALRNTLA